MNCKNCGTEIDDNSEFCKKCGTKVIKAKAIILETNKNTKTKTISSSSSKIIVVIAVIVLVVLIFVMISTIRYNNSLKSNTRPTVSADSGTTSTDSDTSTNSTTTSTDSSISLTDGAKIWVEAQDSVKEKLKSPSTASFPADYQSYITDNGDGTYAVSAYVDSENSFGAKIRNTFTLTIKQDGDSYQYKDLNIENN